MSSNQHILWITVKGELKAVCGFSYHECVERADKRYKDYTIERFQESDEFFERKKA